MISNLKWVLNAERQSLISLVNAFSHILQWFPNLQSSQMPDLIPLEVCNSLFLYWENKSYEKRTHFTNTKHQITCIYCLYFLLSFCYMEKLFLFLRLLPLNVLGIPSIPMFSEHNPWTNFSLAYSVSPSLSQFNPWWPLVFFHFHILSSPL